MAAESDRPPDRNLEQRAAATLNVVMAALLAIASMGFFLWVGVRGANAVFEALSPLDRLHVMVFGLGVVLLSLCLFVGSREVVRWRRARKRSEVVSFLSPAARVSLLIALAVGAWAAASSFPSVQAAYDSLSSDLRRDVEQLGQSLILLILAGQFLVSVRYGASRRR